LAEEHFVSVEQDGMLETSTIMAAILHFCTLHL